MKPVKLVHFITGTEGSFRDLPAIIPGLKRVDLGLPEILALGPTGVNCDVHPGQAEHEAVRPNVGRSVAHLRGWQALASVLIYSTCMAL